MGALTMQPLIDLRQESLAYFQTTETFHRLISGTLSQQIYIRYLLNVYHYAQHSPKVIALASARCLGSHPDVASYLLHHASEEIGHEQWAYADLRKLGVADQQILSSRPGISCVSMIGLEYFTAGFGNPVALLGWLFTLEAFGADLATLVTQRIDYSLNLGGTATHFLSRHGSVDRHHIEDITEAIDKHIKSQADFEDICYIARISQQLYLGILEELVPEDE
jgi:pyrroloquinoline quinone (PQQ) biosynthesis protein C